MVLQKNTEMEVCKMDRIDLYLQNQVGERYANSEEENIMVVKVNSLFCIAQGVRDSIDYVKPSNLEKMEKSLFRYIERT